MPAMGLTGRAWTSAASKFDGVLVSTRGRSNQRAVDVSWSGEGDHKAQWVTP